MKKSISYILFVGLTITALLSCSSKDKRGGRNDTPTSGTISFYADESFSPIIQEEVEQFEYKFPKAHLKPIYTDEITGLQKIKDLKTCLLITSRGLTSREIAYLQTKRQVPEVFPIGYDGLALIVPA